MRLLGLGSFLLALSCPGLSLADELLPDAAAIGVDARHAFTPDAEYVETTVIRQFEGGEVTLRIPEQYFEDFWDRVGGYRDTSQLFRVEIGTWEPVTSAETGTRNAQGIWNWMHFVLGDAISFERVATIGADSFASPEVPLAAYPPREGPGGLAWLDTPYASDKERPERDVFVDPAPPEQLATVIVCHSLANPVNRSPNCTQHFRTGGLDAHVTYDRTELPRWREIQAEVRAFVTCATSEAS